MVLIMDERNIKGVIFSILMIIVFTGIMFFIMNKISTDSDEELAEIIGGVFCTFLQEWITLLEPIWSDLPSS